MSWRARAAAVLITLGIASMSKLGAGDLLVSSRFNSHVLRYDASTGRFVGVFASGFGMANPNGIAYGPDGNLYVGNGDEPRVLEFDGQTGDYLGDFITPATPGGLLNCRAIAFGPDGNLYVNSGSNNRVLAYDGRTGAFLRIAAQRTGMSGPVGLTIDAGGNLYVGAALSNAVYVFDASGGFLRSFNCGSSFFNATGVLLDPLGRLLVAQSVSNTVLSFNPVTGACLGTAATGGGLSVPIGMILAPDGTLLVGSFLTDSVLKYDLATTQPIGTFVTPQPGGLDGTHNFAFVPDLACAQAPAGAAGWWPGDGSVQDLLGGDSATLHNGAGYAPGRDQQSFLLDGVDDYVEVPDAAGLDASGSFAVELWVKTASSSPPDAALAVRDECGGACAPCLTNGFYGISLVQGRVAFQVRDSDPGCRAPQLLQGRAPVGDAQWHHVVATRDVETATLALYVDGALDARSALGAGADGPLLDDDGEADPLTLGTFAGQLDETTFYARSLTACDVRALFESGGGIKCKGDGDQDTVADYQDNCPTDPNPGQANTDGDARGDACDCAPGDAGAFRAPWELGRLDVGLGSDKNRIDWCALDARYGSATSYDVARGDLAGPSGGCLASTSLPLASDPTLPPVGRGFWYLARGRNACGEGTFGFRRDGLERIVATPCP